MIRNALIIDVETTGIDARRDRVVEVGAVLYSVPHRTTLMQVSTIVPGDGNACEAINRIPESAVRDMQEPLSAAAKVLFDRMVEEADVAVAHNAEFDRSFLPSVPLPWVCTCNDFQWPQSTREGGSLVSVALAHGIGVSSAHRALTDCQLIAALFDRMTDLQGMFARAMRPKALFRGLQPFDQNDLAKAAGFRFNRDTKQWTRRMAVEDAAGLGFKVVQIGE
jgi:DNA polymerase-3 subunit epsilon